MIKIDNAKLIDDSIVDIEIENGLIKSLKKSNGKSANGGIDAAGKLLIPGLVDLHTHLREPGREDSETVKTGSEAAVAGGYTAISAMANTNPVADTAGVVEQIYRLGKDTNLCEVNPIGAVTKGLKGEQRTEVGEGRISSNQALCGRVRLSRRDTPDKNLGLVVDVQASVLLENRLDAREHHERNRELGLDVTVVSVCYCAGILVVLGEGAHI